MAEQRDVVIVGGGSAGLSVAARLLNEPSAPGVTIIEPSEDHFYQPLWTLVGAGVFPKEESRRAEADFIPEGAEWVKDRVVSFDPESNQVTTAQGKTFEYRVLVVAAGIQIDWDRVPGLEESVGKPGTGVVSNYSYDTVEQTWETIRNLDSGTAIFTHPPTAVKCAGAPLKICYLAEDHWRRAGVRDQMRVVFAKAGPGIFAVPKYARTLTEACDRRNIERRWNVELVRVDAGASQATFRDMETKEESVMPFDMLHVTPPMSAPAFIAESPLASDAGWVDVDKHSLRHVRYANVYALGDCSSLPTSKTGAAIRKQAPVCAANVMATLTSGAVEGGYDGYTSCPLVTGYGSLILAEFDYDKNPAETFPFDQSKERYSMYALKAYGLPRMYWHGMLRGRA